MKRFMSSPRLLALAFVLSTGAVRAQVRAGPAASASRAGTLPVLPASAIPGVRSYAGDPFHSVGSIQGILPHAGAPTPILASYREHADPKKVLVYYTPDTPRESLELKIAGMKPRSQVWYNDGITRFVTVNARDEAQAMTIARELSNHPFAAKILLHQDLFRRLGELFDGSASRTVAAPGVGPLTLP